MRCPNCGAKIHKGDNRCLKCGTKVDQIKKASNSLVRKARKEYQPELVVYTTVFPADLSFKRTLLWCIFMGWMGGHCYYVQRHIKGIVMTILALIFAIFAVPFSFFMTQGSAGIFNGMVAVLINTGLYMLPCILGAINFCLWIMDLIRIITKSFQIPVVLPEEEKK